MKMYQYKATLLNVVDADTCDFDVDMGFNIRIKQRLRLFGIDAAELNSSDPIKKELTFKAKKFVNDTISVGKTYMIDTYKNDKYGRLLADIHLEDNPLTLNALLLVNNLATPYFGK